MKKIFFILLLLPVLSFSQTNKELIAENQKFQNELNSEYRNPEESPLRGNNFDHFKEHPFFPIDLKYRIKAEFKRTQNAMVFENPTSSGRTQPYLEYGTATFTIDGKAYSLKIYQSQDLIKMKEYEDHLFLPFRDETNGKETYGGGKYMDLKIPEGDEILLDFNKSYQPYCAYNAYDYNCPIVPKENFLPVRIEAGVKYEDIYHH